MRNKKVTRLQRGAAVHYVRNGPHLFGISQSGNCSRSSYHRLAGGQQHGSLAIGGAGAHCMQTAHLVERTVEFECTW